MSSIILSQPGVAHPSAIVGAKAFHWTNAPGFNPLTLSPSFYLNMAANTDANNSVYATMVDSSGNGRDFTAASANMLVKTGVQNGNRVVRLPGGVSDVYLRVTDGATIVTTSAWWILCVGKFNALAAPGPFPSANPAIYANQSGNFNFGNNKNTPIVEAIIDTGVAQNEAAVTTDTSTFHLWMGRLDAGTLYFNQDGGTEATVVSANSAALVAVSVIGASYNYANVSNMDLGALIICPVVPSLALRTAAFNYFKGVWGTP